MSEKNRILTKEESKVLFQITPEQRFKNALNALDNLNADYEISFNGVTYTRKVDRCHPNYGR